MLLGVVICSLLVTNGGLESDAHGIEDEFFQPIVGST